MMDPGLGLLITAGGALLFAAASWHKWRAQREFAAILARYQLLPDLAVAPLAWLIPALEVALALALIAGGEWRRPAALVAAVVLLAYALAIGINLRRGRADLDCGCAVRQQRRPIARWMVLRNALLAAVLGAAAAPWDSRPLGAVDALTVIGGVAIAAFVYVAVDRLLGELAPRAALLRGRG